MKIALFALLLGIASIHARLIDTCVDNTVLLGCRGQPQLTTSDFLIDFSDLDVCFGNRPCYTPGVTYSRRPTLLHFFRGCTFFFAPAMSSFIIFVSALYSCPLFPRKHSLQGLPRPKQALLQPKYPCWRLL